LENTMTRPIRLVAAPTDVSPALPGSWKLKAGRAVTLRPREASLLRVKQGRVWATLHGEPGDHVLVPGSTLHIPAGDRVVIEPWPVQDRQPVFFDWDPSPVYLAAAEPLVTLVAVPARAGAAQRADLRLALRDLRQALGWGVLARVGLVRGAPAPASTCTQA
jgi:Protein of unknown function (DUF2917)